MTFSETKTRQLDQLFSKWIAARRKYKGFKKDGIVNEENFKEPRILFICKEPNDPSLSEGDYRVWWNSEMTHAFSRRLGEWAHGILNNFPKWNSYTDEDSHQALKSIAFMNVKKTGGARSTNYTEIKQYIKRDYVFIREEIDIINPSIVICSLGLSEITRMVFPEITDWIDTGYEIPYSKGSNRIIVDFYHPSILAPGVMSYIILEKVFKIMNDNH